jgi:hypothetical protein
MRAEIQGRLDALGYPKGESLAQSFARVPRDGGGQVPASECIARYIAIARELPGLPVFRAAVTFTA